MKLQNNNNQNLLKTLRGEDLVLELTSATGYAEIGPILTATEKNFCHVNEILNKLRSIFQILDRDEYKLRFREILDRNPDLQFFEDYNVLTRRIEDRVYNTALLSNAEIERSFSRMKEVYNPKRSRLSVENLEMILVSIIMFESNESISIIFSQFY